MTVETYNLIINWIILICYHHISKIIVSFTSVYNSAAVYLLLHRPCLEINSRPCQVPPQHSGCVNLQNPTSNFVRSGSGGLRKISNSGPNRITKLYSPIIKVRQQIPAQWSFCNHKVEFKILLGFFFFFAY